MKLSDHFTYQFFLLLAVMLVSVMTVMPAQAARVQNLYTAELMVAQQSMQVESALGGDALSEVLVKVSGRTDIFDHLSIRDAIAAPQRFIQQFSYQSAGLSMTNEEGLEVPAQRLKIDFIPLLVDQLLNEAGYRPLGAERPGVLVWIVEERGQRREFLGREEDPAFAPMRDRARQRGLPVFRPLMDLEDQGALAVADAWGFFAEPVLQASSRYQADAVLVGRLFPIGGRWQSRWMLLRNGERMLFDGSGTTLDEHLSTAVDQAADRVFADFVAAAAAAPEGIIIDVGNVTRFADFAAIVDYLREIPVVREVMISEVQNDLLSLKLQLNGSLKQLQSAIALNNRFAVQDTPLRPLTDAALNYHWSR